MEEKKLIPTRAEKKPVILQSSPSVEFCQHQRFSFEFPRSDGALKHQDYKNEEPFQNHKGEVSAFS